MTEICRYTKCTVCPKHLFSIFQDMFSRFHTFHHRLICPSLKKKKERTQAHPVTYILTSEIWRVLLLLESIIHSTSKVSLKPWAIFLRMSYLKIISGFLKKIKNKTKASLWLCCLSTCSFCHLDKKRIWWNFSKTIKDDKKNQQKNEVAAEPLI